MAVGQLKGTRSGFFCCYHLDVKQPHARRSRAFCMGATAEDPHVAASARSASTSKH